MRNIAFALDPDGYWVEVVGQKPLEETEDVTTTDVATYRMVGWTRLRADSRANPRAESYND